MNTRSDISSKEAGQYKPSYDIYRAQYALKTLEKNKLGLLKKFLRNREWEIKDNTFVKDNATLFRRLGFVIKMGNLVDNPKLVENILNLIDTVLSGQTVAARGNEHITIDWFCGYCGKEDPGFKCSCCKFVGYCSAECQKKDWPEHRLVCTSSYQQ